MTTKEIAAEIKTAIKAMKGVKLSVTTKHSTISVDLMEAPFQAIVNNEIVRGRETYNGSTHPFNGNYGINHYYFRDDKNLTPETLAVFELVHGIISKYHWDKSDSMTDYFHCSFYIDYGIGKWNRPFVQK